MELDYLYQLLTEDYTTNIPIYRKTLEKAGYDNPDELIDLVVQIDPTHNKYVSWLIKQLKFKNIRLPEDGNRVNEVLTKFLEYSKSPQFPYNKDVYQYKRIHDIEEIISKIEGIDLTSNRQKIDDIKTEGAKWINRGEKYSMIELLTPEAASYYGRNTKWCTTDIKVAKKYLSSGRLFIILEGNEKIAQMHYDGKEFQLMDVIDDELDMSDDLDSYLENVLLHVIKDPLLLAGYSVYTEQPWPAAEPIIMKNLEAIHQYNMLKGDRWPEAEPIIMKDPKIAVEYADFNLNGERWPEAEKYIIKDPIAAVNYARSVIKGRWPEAEKYIMKDSDAAIDYVTSVLGNKRWPKAEPTIAKDPYTAYRYVYNVLDKERWPEAEPTIMKNPEAARYYAINVIKGRWPEAEKYIMKDSHAAYNYTRNIIKDRWPEAEPIIMKEPYTAHNYAYYVIKGRWPEAEKYIIKSPGAAVTYAAHVIKGRWPEAEPIIMKDSHAAATYAIDVIKGRWPEAEKYIKTDDNAWDSYIHNLN